MSQNREKGGRVVFIGNIPYGVSEEQICELFARCGTVVNFRLVYDKETGRPKGFGFLEYTDVDAAAAAVRNLDGFELNKRALKVDYSNDNDKGGNRGGGGGDHDIHNRAPPPAHFNMNAGGPPAPNALPTLPPGAPLPHGLTAPDAISRTLQAIPPDQLLDILSQFKGLSQTDPAKATELINSAPQLGYAIFQALLMMNLVSTDVLHQLIQSQAQPTAPPPQQQAPPPQMPPTYPPPQQYQQPPAYPPQIPYGMPPGYAPTPPQHQAYQPPPPQQQANPLAGAQDQAQLVQTIMSLTRDQIMGLDEAARNQVLLLRQSMGAPPL